MYRLKMALNEPKHVAVSKKLHCVLHEDTFVLVGSTFDLLRSREVLMLELSPIEVFLVTGCSPYLRRSSEEIG
jgi:hypothetical protein